MSGKSKDILIVILAVVVLVLAYLYFFAKPAYVTSPVTNTFVKEEKGNMIMVRSLDGLNSLQIDSSVPAPKNVELKLSTTMREQGPMELSPQEKITTTGLHYYQSKAGDAGAVAEYDSFPVSGKNLWLTITYAYEFAEYGYSKPYPKNIQEAIDRQQQDVAQYETFINTIKFINQ
jgi:hypothetical protein